MAEADFSRKLDLVLKALSISRGSLPAALGVTKSQVSRWISGENTPTGHNMAALTQLIAARRPGFSLLDWERSLEDLSAVLGGPSAPGANGGRDAPPNLDWLPVSRAQSAVEIRREGDAYPGLYVGFHLLFRNTGEVAPDLFIIWRRGDRLMFRQFEIAFTHTGEVLILRHQLFVVGEDDARADGLVSYLFNGVTGQKALRLDGLVMTVLGDRFRTPTASPLVLQRLADLEDPGAPPPHDDLAALLGRLRAMHRQGDLEALAGPAIIRAIRPVVGVPSPDGAMDHVLRRAGEATLSASELDWTPALDADLRRVRAAVLDRDDPLPLVGRYNLARALDRA
jgi:transcriptional regulator with XRE-family HTH domain